LKRLCRGLGLPEPKVATAAVSVKPAWGSRQICPRKAVDLPSSVKGRGERLSRAHVAFRGRRLVAGPTRSVPMGRGACFLEEVFRRPRPVVVQWPRLSGRGIAEAAPAGGRGCGRRGAPRLARCRRPRRPRAPTRPCRWGGRRHRLWLHAQRNGCGGVGNDGRLPKDPPGEHASPGPRAGSPTSRRPAQTEGTAAIGFELPPQMACGNNTPETPLPTGSRS